MEYVAGEEFLGYVTRVGPLPEGVLRGLLTPLLDGLSAVHGAGYLHRDIKPDNIVLRGSDVGSPVLLDFGAARLAMGAHSRRLTVVLTPGYAPIEQYSEASEQGPYTDVYALGAVLYYGLTGEAPQEATDRMLDDRLPSRLAQLAGSGGISRDFLVGLEAALQVDPRNRPASLAAWRRQLDPEGKLPESALRANSRSEVVEAGDSEELSATVGQSQDGGDNPLEQEQFKQQLVEAMNRENKKMKQEQQVNIDQLARKIVSEMRSAPGGTFTGYAGFWKRFAALFLDVIVWIVFSAVMIVILGIEEQWELDFLNVLLYWIYCAVMESSSAQGTLGKMALRIKVTDMEGNRIGFGRATGRHFGRAISFVILLIGFIMVAFTEKKQGLHDIMAGCLVVNK